MINECLHINRELEDGEHEALPTNFSCNVPGGDQTVGLRNFLFYHLIEQRKYVIVFRCPGTGLSNHLAVPSTAIFNAEW